MKHLLKLLSITLVLKTSFVYAQDYKIETLSNIVGENESALFTDGGTLLVGTKPIKSGEQLFIYDWKAKKKVEIKNSSLKIPFAVNSSGRVVGRTKSYTSVIWDKNGKTIELGRLSSSDNESIALSVNSKGTVVGYSGITGEGDSGYIYSFRPFVYSDKTGFKELPVPAGESWIASSISNNGEILAFKFSDSNSSHAAILKEDGSVIKEFRLRNNFYYTKLLEAKLLSRDIALVSSEVYDLKNKKRWEIGTSIIPGRDDYGKNFAINSSLEAVGYKRGLGFISTQSRGDIPLNCLVPRTQSLKSGKPNLTVESLSFVSVAGIDNAGNVIFTGDQSGDSLGTKIFVAKRTRQRTSSGSVNYCPSMTASIRCDCLDANANKVICSETVKSDGLLNSIYVSFADNSLASGGSCQVSIRSRTPNQNGRLLGVKITGNLFSVTNCSVEAGKGKVGNTFKKFPLRAAKSLEYYIEPDSETFPTDLWMPGVITITTPFDPFKEEQSGCFIKR